MRQEQKLELHLLALGGGTDGKKGRNASGRMLLCEPRQVQAVSKMSMSVFKKIISKQIITLNQ